LSGNLGKRKKIKTSVKKGLGGKGQTPRNVSSLGEGGDFSAGGGVILELNGSTGKGGGRHFQE